MARPSAEQPAAVAVVVFFPIFAHVDPNAGVRLAPLPSRRDRRQGGLGHDGNVVCPVGRLSIRHSLWRRFVVGSCAVLAALVPSLQEAGSKAEGAKNDRDPAGDGERRRIRRRGGEAIRQRRCE